MKHPVPQLGKGGKVTRTAREGIDRRDLLRLGRLCLLGAVPLLAARQVRGKVRQEQLKGFGKAKACIVLFQVGGPYQCDTFDPKPDASEEVRGIFQPVATSVPGIRVTEALSRTAKLAKHWSVIRSMHHLIRCHNPAIYCSLVGREATDPMAVSSRTNAARTDHPHYASVVARLKRGVIAMPKHVIIPNVVFNGPAKSPGLSAGYLGASYDPFVLGTDPAAESFEVEGVGLPENVDHSRFGNRKSLLQELESKERLVEKNDLLVDRDAAYRQAFDILTTSRAKQAFDLNRESPAVRDRYGRSGMGQGTLLARRLVEAGVPFVTVFSHTQVERESWDTHNRHYELSKSKLLPPNDQCLSALIEDLVMRGMLDDTLVIWMGEFGRTPKMGVNFSNNSNNVGGRDHWCNCYSVLLAGGGVQGGQVIGSSDKFGGYPKERPVHISDLAATIYHALGIAPRTQLHDIQGQLRFVCDGSPVDELFA